MNEPKNSHSEIKIDTELLRNIMVNVSDVHINVSQDLKKDEEKSPDEALKVNSL